MCGAVLPNRAASAKSIEIGCDFPRGFAKEAAVKSIRGHMAVGKRIQNQDSMKTFSGVRSLRFRASERGS